MDWYPELHAARAFGLQRHDTDRAVLHIGPRHRHDVGPALASIKQEREGQPLSCPDWPCPFELGDFLLSPGMEFALGELLDPKGRVVFPPSVIDREMNQNLQLLQDAVGSTRRAGSLTKDATHVLSRHLANETMANALIDEQPLDDGQVSALTRRREGKKLW